jgi:hypothetical protein
MARSSVNFGSVSPAPPPSSGNAPARSIAPPAAEQAQLLSVIKRKTAHVITDDEWLDFESVAMSRSKARAR